MNIAKAWPALGLGRRARGLCLALLIPAALTVSVPAADAAASCPTVVGFTVTPAPSAGVDWSGCDLRGASFEFGADLKNANLTNADLTGASLRYALLNGANLTGANLTSAWLGADVRNATLTNAILTDARLSGVRSGGIIGTPADLPSPWILNHGFLLGPGAKLGGADLSGVDLTGADLTGADLVSATGCSITGVPIKLPVGYFIEGGCLKTVPDEPFYVEADGATLFWGPRGDGGSPITGYVIGVSPGARVLYATPSDTSKAITGLVPGVSYTFSVRVRNAGGLGPAMSTTARGTRLTIKVSPTSVTYGSPVTVVASLTTSTGTPLSGQPLNVMSRLADSSSIRGYGSMSTRSTGNAWMSVTPLRGASLYVDYLGSTGLLPRTSARVVVTVRPKVAVALNDASISRGQLATFTGKVSPNAKGRKVYLQRIVNGRWSTVMGGTLTESSRYAFRWRPSTGFDTSFRVYVPARPGYGSNVSRGVKLTVA